MYIRAIKSEQVVKYDRVHNDNSNKMIELDEGFVQSPT